MTSRVTRVRQLCHSAAPCAIAQDALSAENVQSEAVGPWPSTSMSYAKRQREQELAEVASGQRKSASWGLEVSIEESNKAKEQREHESALQASARRAADSADHLARWSERSTRAQEAAARDARESKALAAQALHEQRQQQQRDEERKRDRDEAEAAHRERVEELHQLSVAESVRANKCKEAQIAMEMERASAHRELIEEAEQRRDEHNRLSMSPCYLAAHRLQELRSLEARAREARELEDLAHDVDVMCDQLRVAEAEASAKAEAAVAAFLQAESVRIADLEKRASEEAKAIRKRVERTLKACNEALLEAQSELSQLTTRRHSVRVTLNPATWKPGLSRQRAELDKALGDVRQVVEARRVQCKQAELGIASAASAGSRPIERQTFEPESVDAALLREVRRSGLYHEAKARYEAIHRWATEPRTMEFRRVFIVGDEIHHVSIDFETCVALDHCRTQAGGAAVEYPGLGALPLGTELAVVVQRIAHMKSSGALFDAMSPPPRWVKFDQLAKRLRDLSKRVEGRQTDVSTDGWYAW